MCHTVLEVRRNPSCIRSLHICIDVLTMLPHRFASLVHGCKDLVSVEDELIQTVLENPELACFLDTSSGHSCAASVVLLEDIDETTCNTVESCVVPFLPFWNGIEGIREYVPWEFLCQLCSNELVDVPACQ